MPRSAIQKRSRTTISPLTPGQQRACIKVGNVLDENECRAYLAAPPGSGKTWLARELVQHIAKNERRLCIYVADSAALSREHAYILDAKLGAQNTKTFLQRIASIASTDGGVFTVTMTRESFRGLLQNSEYVDQVRNKFGTPWIVVMDEAHKLTKTSCMASRIRDFYARHDDVVMHMLLMSGTPGFNDTAQGRAHLNHASVICGTDVRDVYQEFGSDLHATVLAERNCPFPMVTVTEKTVSSYNEHHESMDDFAKMLCAYHRLSECDPSPDLGAIKMLYRRALENCAIVAESVAFLHQSAVEQFEVGLSTMKRDDASVRVGNAAYVVSKCNQVAVELSKYPNFDVHDLTGMSRDEVKQQLARLDEIALAKGRAKDAKIDLIVLAKQHMHGVDHFTGRTCTRINMFGISNKDEQRQIAGRLGRPISIDSTTLVPREYSVVAFRVEKVRRALSIDSAKFNANVLSCVLGAKYKPEYDKVFRLSDREFYDEWDREFRLWLSKDGDEEEVEG